MKKIQNQKLTASVHYPGESNDSFLIESEKYSSKKDFKEALYKSGLIVVHISTERDLYEK